MKKQFFTYSSIILAILLIFHIVKVVQRIPDYSINGTGDYFSAIFISLT